MSEITDKLRVLVAAEVDKAIADLQKLDKTVSKTESQTLKLGKALDELKTPVTAVSALLAASGTAAIKYAGDIEQTGVSLRVMLKDADKATQIFGQWQKLAANTPLKSADIERAGKSLIAFNIEAGKVTPTLKNIGDVSSGVGANIADIAEIYGKAKVQGRLFAEDINQFQGRGIPIVQELAKQFGTSQSAIKEMVAEGKIGFTELEKSFQSLAGPGGQFEGMMEELSTTTLGKFSTALDNGKLALASFGEIMLPTANEMLDSAIKLFQGFEELDDGTKRFIITMAGVTAASGPVILAIGGINKAMLAIAANPAIIGITASIVAIALVVSAVNKAKNAYSDFESELLTTKKTSDSLLSSYAEGNTKKKLDEEATQELIRLYPNLSGKVKAYTTTVEEASDAVNQLVNQKLLDNESTGLADFRKKQDEIDQILAKAQKYRLSGNQMDVSAANDLDKQAQTMLDDLEKQRAKINERIKSSGRELNSSGAIVPIPIILQPEITTVETADISDVKKKWQQVFESVTGIDQKLFAGSGQKAAELYIKGIDTALSTDATIAKALNEKFDIAESLQTQQDAIKKTITDLLSTKDINDPFAVTDGAISALIEKYNKLGAAKKEAEKETENQKTIADTMAELKKKTDDLTKSEKELTIAKLESAGATPEQVQQAIQLMQSMEAVKKAADKNTTITQTLDDLKKKVSDLTKSEKELTIAKLESAGATPEQVQQAMRLMHSIEQLEKEQQTFDDVVRTSITEALNQWGKFDAGTVSVLSNFGSSLTSLSFDAALTGLTELGKAFGEGKDASASLTQALTATAEQILNQLPSLFLQAGLQMIVQGNWPMGLAFIAAAGSAAVMGGFASSKIAAAKEEASDVTANAKGGVYGGNVTAFKKGGSFTNSIVTSPTLFRYAQGGGFGKGLMGEAGAEAIMPLERGPDGSLGVRNYGGGNEAAAVYIAIYNSTGEKVTTQESTATDGTKQVEVFIGAMNSAMVSGRFDKALAGRYKIKPQGI